MYNGPKLFRNEIEDNSMEEKNIYDNPSGLLHPFSREQFLSVAMYQRIHIGFLTVIV